MKFNPFLILGILLTAASAPADVTITQQIEQPGQKPMTMVMKIKGDKVRNDVNQQMTAIMDSRTGDTTTLMHDQKVAMKIPGALVKATQNQAMKALKGGGDDLEPSKPEPTGRKEVISGFNCEEYIGTHGGKKVEIWVTKDIADAEEITRQFTSLASDTNPTADLVDPMQVDGFPIRTSAEIAPGKQVTMTVTDLSRDPIPDGEFEVPAGYREMAMPQVPMP